MFGSTSELQNTQKRDVKIEVNFQFIVLGKKHHTAQIITNVFRLITIFPNPVISENFSINLQARQPVLSDSGVIYVENFSNVLTADQTSKRQEQYDSYDDGSESGPARCKTLFYSFYQNNLWLYS